MIDDPEVSLETEHLEDVIDSPPPGQPVVVIQYRSRGIPAYIAFPLLVLVALGSVAFYHRLNARSRNPAWEAPAEELPQSKPLPTGTSPSISDADLAKGITGLPPLTPTSIEVPIPLALNSQPIVPGTLSLAPGHIAWPPIVPGVVPRLPTEMTPPAAPDASKPVVLPPPPPAPAPLGDGRPTPPGAPANADRPPPGGAVAVGFNVPRGLHKPSRDPLDPERALESPADPAVGSPSPEENPVPEPGPDQPPATVAEAHEPPLPEKGELLDEIAKEAAKKKSEIKQLREIKDRARAEVHAESLQRVEDDRAVFRRELAEIVKAGGRGAGEQIDSLCQRYGRNYDPALRAKVTYVLAHTNGRVSKEARVRQLRGYGVPEAGILDYLANDIHRYINSRNGPRDSNDVRVNAAKQLLGIKLNREPRRAAGDSESRGRGQAALTIPTGPVSTSRAQ